jgi:hypothetical protein
LTTDNIGYIILTSLVEKGVEIQMQDFEKSFEGYLESNKHEVAESALLTIVRTAYTAGWSAAGGESPPSNKAGNQPDAEKSAQA